MTWITVKKRQIDKYREAGYGYRIEYAGLQHAYAECASQCNMLEEKLIRKRGQRSEILFFIEKLKNITSEQIEFDEIL